MRDMFAQLYKKLDYGSINKGPLEIAQLFDARSRQTKSTVDDSKNIGRTTNDSGRPRPGTNKRPKAEPVFNPVTPAPEGEERVRGCCGARRRVQPQLDQPLQLD